MIIYPAIELYEGGCGILWRGETAKPTRYGVDPAEAARAYAGRGASWVHVNDLDAAADRGENAAIVREIVRTTPARVQIMGGVRSMAAVENWIDAGAARVVIRAGAIVEPEFVQAACRAYPDQIVLGIDVKDGCVFDPRGETVTAYDPIKFAQSFENIALSAILFTDLDREGDVFDGSLGVTAELARAVTTPVISSGLVAALDDVTRLKFTPNIAGAVIGRALFDGAFTLEEALAAGAPETASAAPFIVSPMDVPPDQRP